MDPLEADGVGGRHFPRCANGCRMDARTNMKHDDDSPESHPDTDVVYHLLRTTILAISENVNATKVHIHDTS